MELKEMATKLLREAGHYGGPKRVEKLVKVLESLGDDQRAKLRFEECGDENTGVRYGNAKKRCGRAAKIYRVMTYRGPGMKKPFQVWAVWS